MLPNRTASKASTFNIPTIDDALAPIDATAASWELLDARGVSIATAPVNPFDPSAHIATFTIDGGHLTLADGETSAGRELVVTLTTTTGDVELRDYFVLVDGAPLAISNNSLITYTEAVALRQEFASLPGWDSRPQADQTAALIEAYRRLCRMAFRVTGFKADDQSAVLYAAFGTGRDIPWSYGRRIRLGMLSQADFDAMPEPFQRAVKRAQIAEANVLLGGDPVGAKRAAGIISEKIGETSMFFQSKPFLNLPISKAAYEECRRYIHMQINLARG